MATAHDTLARARESILPRTASPPSQCTKTTRNEPVSNATKEINVHFGFLFDWQREDCARRNQFILVPNRGDGPPLKQQYAVLQITIRSICRHLSPDFLLFPLVVEWTGAYEINRCHFQDFRRNNVESIFRCCLIVVG
jgi:hypothetical protein